MQASLLYGGREGIPASASERCSNDSSSLLACGLPEPLRRWEKETLPVSPEWAEFGEVSQALRLSV